MDHDRLLEIAGLVRNIIAEFPGPNEETNTNKVSLYFRERNAFLSLCMTGNRDIEPSVKALLPANVYGSFLKSILFLRDLPGYDGSKRLAILAHLKNIVGIIDSIPVQATTATPAMPSTDGRMERGLFIRFVNHFRNCALTKRPFLLFLLIFIAFFKISPMVFPFLVDSTPRINNTDEALIHREGADHLIVVLHGSNGLERMGDVIKLVRKNHEKADFYLPEMNTANYSNVKPGALADIIRGEIAQHHEEYDYEKITLLGYSAGALILRKAVLDGFHKNMQKTGGLWIKKVDRIILLAGMNAGWSVNKEQSTKSASHTSVDTLNSKELILKIQMNLGRWLGNFANVGGFLRALESGSEFIADLRVEWMQLTQLLEAKRDGVPSFPKVIQLLGTLDILVGKEDSMDLWSTRNSIVFRDVSGADHGGLVKLFKEDGVKEIGERAILLRWALNTPLSDLRVGGDKMPPQDRSVTDVVFIEHGIRDFPDEWIDAFRSEIKMVDDSLPSQKVIVKTPNYGYFPMGAFLFFGKRQENVRIFMDSYTRAKAQYPIAKMRFIGHSNGTYILANALEKYSSIEMERVVFAGSVVSSSYPWEKKIVNATGEGAQVKAIANIYGSSDWVVGIFSGMFEVIENIPVLGFLFSQDLGYAGYRGFSKNFDCGLLPKSGEQRCQDIGPVQGGHGIAINPDTDMFPDIVRFVLGEKDSIAIPERDEMTVMNLIVGFLSKSSPFVWLLLAASLLFVGCRLAGIVPRREGTVLIIYGVFLIVVLHVV